MTKREAVIEALKALFEADPDIKTVFRLFKPLDTISSAQFPCVIIEENLPELGFEWKSSGFADVQFQVSLVMAVMDNVNVAAALTNLDTVVKRILATNPTVSGTCTVMKPEPEIDRLGSQYAPYGMSIRPITITYEGAATDGY